MEATHIKNKTYIHSEVLVAEFACITILLCAFGSTPPFEQDTDKPLLPHFRAFHQSQTRARERRASRPALSHYAPSRILTAESGPDWEAEDELIVHYKSCAYEDYEVVRALVLCGKKTGEVSGAWISVLWDLGGERKGLSCS